MTPKHLVEVKDRPEEIIERAVKGMLPKNRLRKVRQERLHVFKGSEHNMDMPGLVMKLDLDDANVKFRL